MGRLLEIANRINHLKNELEEVNLIAVSKYSPLEDLLFAYEAGQCDFGENKVLDLKNKAAIFFEKNLNLVRWHYIGHLQSNKVKDLLKIPNLYAIHSVDSLKIINELKKNQHHLNNNELKIFLQVNTSKEEEKSGFESIDELEIAVENLLQEKSVLKFSGLMTMGTFRTEAFEVEALRCFNELITIKKHLEEKFHLKDLQLSMGMSQDYLIAKECGSNFVRIGTAIFK